MTLCVELLLFVVLVTFFLLRLDGFTHVRCEARAVRKRYIRVTYGVVGLLVLVMLLLPTVVR